MRCPGIATARRRILIASLLVVLVVTPPSLAAAQDPAPVPPPPICGDDFTVPGGHFFSQAAGTPDLGFHVTDDAQAAFWSAFQRIGGVPVLGYPISERFVLRGFIVQAFQKAVLQWDPSKQDVNFANTLDLLHDAGFDPWLDSVRQVPLHQSLPADDDAPWDRVVGNHLAILDANAHIRAEFLATPNWLDRLGLPIAYHDYGAVRVLRAQRAVLQQWTSDVPWAAAGEVIFGNSGDLAREAGLFSADVLAPIAPRPPDDLTGVVRVEPNNPAQGETLALEVATGHFGVALLVSGRSLPLVCAAGAWRALDGLGATAQTGPRGLRVAIGDGTADLPIEVAAGEFPSVTFELPEDLQGLLDPELVAQEREFYTAIVSQVSGPPRWSGRFVDPAGGRPTSVYGERRTLEPGMVATVHQGADLAAPLGTPVLASADGLVAWAGPLVVRGNVVIIDHGFGVFTAYYHLDEIGVATAAEITTGRQLGTVGSSGRSTGPHLHWEVLIGGVAVDPAAWTDRSFPEDFEWTVYVGPDGAVTRRGDVGSGMPETVPPTPPAPTGDTPAPPPEASTPPEDDGGLETGVPPPDGPAG